MSADVDAPDAGGALPTQSGIVGAAGRAESQALSISSPGPGVQGNVGAGLGAGSPLTISDRGAPGPTVVDAGAPGPTITAAGPSTAPPIADAGAPGPTVVDAGPPGAPKLPSGPSNTVIRDTTNEISAGSPNPSEVPSVEPPSQAPEPAAPAPESEPEKKAGLQSRPLNQAGRRRNRFFARRGRSSIQVNQPAGAGLQIKRSGISGTF